MRGRADVVRDLFLAHRQRVFALCLHITGRRAEAEDVLQEAFLAVHRGLSGFRGQSRLSTWLYRIAIRTAFAVRARRKPSAPLPDDLIDAAPGPDRLAGARQQAVRLLGAFDALSADQRTILSMFAVDGLRHGEIAEILGIAEGTVWSRLHAARRALACATETL